jgi:DNA-binding NarL/FixJ family response regulator
MARQIKITPATVSSHTARICRKLGLAGRAEAAEAGRMKQVRQFVDRREIEARRQIDRPIG